MDEQLTKQIEAILFSCGRQIDVDEISAILGVGSSGVITELVTGLIAEYEKRDSPIMIISEGNGWKMTVREKYLPSVRKITPYMEFSKTLMETLAVVAWKQPIVQSEVIKVRTNKAYEHIAELEKMGFLSKEKHGRSFYLKLSQKFYDYFDLRDDIDVRNLFKHIKDDEPIEQKKMNEFNGNSKGENDSEITDNDNDSGTIDNDNDDIDNNYEANDNVNETPNDSIEETNETIDEVNKIITEENEINENIKDLDLNDQNNGGGDVSVEDEISRTIDSDEVAKKKKDLVIDDELSNNNDKNKSI